MKRAVKRAVVAIASTASLAMLVDASVARPCAHTRFYREWPASPRLYRSNPGTNYYNVCGYGDCACLRSRAVATGSQVWWDRYQACHG